MPAISVILDFALKVLSEPGFAKNIPSRDLSTAGAAVLDGASAAALWTEPTTKTVMLRPLQFNGDWLNSTAQLPWVLRLSEMTVNPTDVSNGLIYEQPAYGNTANPWIYFAPTLPASYFPAATAPGESVPGSSPSLVGVSPGPILPSSLITDGPVRPVAGYSIPPTMPGPTHASDPAPVQVVDNSTGVFPVYTDVLPANQGLFLRWTHPNSKLGFAPVYRFYIGQFCLVVMEQVVQVFQDDSAHGDRSHFSHLATLPLFSAQDDDRGIAGNIGAIFQGLYHPHEVVDQERCLCWLPFRRNQVHISGASSHGPARSCLIQTRPVPEMLADGSDWNIVRSDKLVIWALSPKLCRLQVQRLAYPAGTHSLNTPPVTLDYTPASPPAQTLSTDAFHGSAVGVVQSQPPSYSYPVNNTRECVTLPTYSSYQAIQYGCVVSLTAGDGNAWSPYFYNLLIHKEPVLSTPTKPTPYTINDTTDLAHSPPNAPVIVSATVSVGRKPGEGRATIEAIDYSTYPLAPYYYRCGQPIQVKNGTTPVFTGYTLPQGVDPLKVDGMRKISFSASDRWWQLDNYFLRDNRCWAGTGHIDVVQNILQQAGVDVAGMDTPAKTAVTNQVLGDLPGAQTANEQAFNTLSPWQPKSLETAGSFLKRICESFSGWDLGFQADGTPFYRPKYYYTASELTFYESAAAATTAGHTGAPVFRRATFSTIEPEANCVVVYALSRQGGPLVSSVFIDWQSILNTNCVNYLGRRKFLGVQLAGAFSCRGINWAARTIWNIARRRHIIARFNCDYNDLIKVGHVITLHTYGDYRIISATHRFDKQAWQTSQVEAEYVESGSTVTGAP